MTSYATYDAGLPCRNPSCKSHGKPHPNCRCYPGLAHGGTVEHFCSSHRSHEKTCKYYADGGDVEFSAPQHEDPSLSTASYLSQDGLHGLIEMPFRGYDQAESIMKYNQSVKKGHKKFDTRVEHLFKAGLSEKLDHTKARKTIDEWIEKGGINHDLQQEIYNQNAAQNFAEGGDVEESHKLHNNHIAEAYPDQNMILQTVKGRASNYLASLKPQKDMPRLAFDGEPDTRAQEKSYKRALKIAADPLRVLDKVKSGTIEPEHVKHFKNMYPEVDEALQKKLSDRIVKAQLNGEKPSFKVRQGLSLLMGTPLSGELSQQNMMAAQNVFRNKKAGDQQQASPQPQKKTSAIAKSSQSYLLPNQAAAERQQKQ